MGYKEALEATGAIVIDYQEFGSYQGDWFAIIDYLGKRSVINGSYGSCSGCDGFQDAFGYSDPSPEKLRTFGEHCIESGSMTIDEATTYAKKFESWDSEAGNMVSWLYKLKKAEFSNKLGEIVNEKI